MNDHIQELFYVIIYQSQRSIAFPHTGGVVTPSFLKWFPAAARPQRRATRLKGILSPSSAYCTEPLNCCSISLMRSEKTKRIENSTAPQNGGDPSGVTEHNFALS